MDEMRKNSALYLKPGHLLDVPGYETDRAEFIL